MSGKYSLDLVQIMPSSSKNSLKNVEPGRQELRNKQKITFSFDAVLEPIQWKTVIL